VSPTETRTSRGEPVSSPSFRALIANFREYDAPLGTKLRLAARNTWIKLRQRSNCCGHPGEPGC
jgi:hypothetical protein